MSCCCFCDSRPSNDTIKNGYQWAGSSGRNNCVSCTPCHLTARFLHELQRPNIQCSANHLFPLSGNNPSAWYDHSYRNTERSRLCQETTIVSEKRGHRSSLGWLWNRNTGQSGGGGESNFGFSVGQTVKRRRLICMIPYML